MSFSAEAGAARARYGRWDIEQLRRQCRDHSLSAAGLKMELVDRLVESELQQARRQARKEPPSDELLLPPAGRKPQPQPAHSVSALDLAPVQPRSLPPLRAGANRRLPPLSQPEVRSKKKNNKKTPKALSAEDVRDETIRDLVSNAFKWPADEVAQQHEDRVYPRTATGQPMSCWAPEVDVEFMGLLGGVGLRLYFEFLRACALLFAGLTVLAAPALYFNYVGAGLKSEHPTSTVKTTHGNLLPEMRETPFVECTESQFYDIECCKVATEGAAAAVAGLGVLSPSCGGKLQELYYIMTCTSNWTQQIAAPARSTTAGANTTLASVYDYANLCSGFCVSLQDSCSDLPMFNPGRAGPGGRGRTGSGSVGVGEQNVTEMWNEAAAAVGEDAYSSQAVTNAHRQCFLAGVEAQAWADEFEGWGEGLRPGELGRGQRASALYVGWGNVSCVGAAADAALSHWELQVCAVCDGVSALFVLTWYLWMMRRQRWIVKDQDADMISMSDYTVQVVCRTIPQDTGKEELLSWMEQRFGPVVLLEMCVDNDEAIGLYEAKAALVARQEGLIARSKRVGFSCKPVLEAGQEYTGPHAAELTAVADEIAIVDENIRAESLRRAPDSAGAGQRGREGNTMATKFERYKTISAFVTFETDESFELAMKWEKIGKYRKQLGGRLIRDGYQVHLNEAPEPDTVIWEHLEYGQAERRKRRFAVNCVVIFVLFLSFCGIIIVSIFKTTATFLNDCPTILSELVASDHTVAVVSVSESGSGEGYTNASSPYSTHRLASGKEAEYTHLMCALVDVAYSNISTQTISAAPSFDLFATCFDEEVAKAEPVSEYCEDQAKYATLQRYRDSDRNAHSACYQCLCDTSDESVGLFENATGVATGSYCNNWDQHSLFVLVAKYVATVIVTVFNQIIKAVMAKIVMYEKPHTLGAMQSSLMLKVFAAQLFNTALLVVILNSSKEALGIVGVIIDKMRPSGQYFDDFSNDWYNNVGAAIISAMLIQNVTPPAAQILTGVLSNWKRGRKRRATLRHARGEQGEQGCLSLKTCMACACLDGEPAYTDDELRNSVTGPDFKIAACYAEAFLLVFVSLMYGSGLPILYPLAVFGFTFKFFVGKWAILAVYRDPPMFGPQFGTTTMQLMPCALVLHCCVGVWIWGRRTVAAVEWAQGSGFWLGFAGRAVGAWHTVPLAVVVIVIVAVYASWWFGTLILRKTDTECEKRYRAWKEQRDEQQDSEEGSAHQTDAVPDFSSAVRQGLFVDGSKTITSYAIQDNPDYARAFSHLLKQKETEQYKRIISGVRGDALSLRGHVSPPATPRQAGLQQTDEEDEENSSHRRETRAAENWAALIEALMELKKAELEAADAKLERQKAKEIAQRKWRAAHPPRPRAGQCVISRRMWLHQLQEDVAKERSPSARGEARMGPLDVSRLPLSDAWEKHCNGRGGLPLRSAGDVYCAGERTEREFYEQQRVQGAGGGLGAQYFLRQRPSHSPAYTPRYPNDTKRRAERQAKAAEQMIEHAEDEFYGNPAKTVDGPRSMVRRDFTGAKNRSALREYS